MGFFFFFLLKPFSHFWWGLGVSFLFLVVFGGRIKRRRRLFRFMITFM